MKKDWIKIKLKESNMNKKLVYSMLDSFNAETNSNWTISSYERLVRKCYNELKLEIDEFEYQDSIEEIIKLESNKQKLRDTNNYLRKVNRENFRIYNSVEELYKNYVDLLQKVDLSKFDIKTDKNVKNNKRIGILHLSDFHANELITPNESFGNEYNFEVLSKRLKKLIKVSIEEFKNNNVGKVVIILTGDLINSSRRLSEKVAMATSLASASLLLTYILEQAIIELLQYFEIGITFCVGNESRIEQDYMDNSNILASNNYDFLIFHNLRYIFKDKLDFIIPKNNVTSVVTLDNDFNFLITHGHIFKNDNITKQISQFLQQYIFNGIKINAVFMGHFHNAQIGDLVSICGSLCGANSYSSNSLGYYSRSSQNIYIINDDLSYKGIKIDLQNTDDISRGYNIIEELENYDTKTSYNNKVVIQNLC